MVTFQKVLMCFLWARALAFHLWFYKVLPWTVLGHAPHFGQRGVREASLQPPCLSSSSVALIPIEETRSRSDRVLSAILTLGDMLEGQMIDHFFVPLSTLLCYEMQIIIAL